VCRMRPSAAFTLSTSPAKTRAQRSRARAFFGSTERASAVHSSGIRRSAESALASVVSHSFALRAKCQCKPDLVVESSTKPRV